MGVRGSGGEGDKGGSAAERAARGWWLMRVGLGKVFWPRAHCTGRVGGTLHAAPWVCVGEA